MLAGFRRAPIAIRTTRTALRIRLAGASWPWGLLGMGIKSHGRAGRRVMTKGRRVQVGALLILVGAAFVVLKPVPYHGPLGS